MLLPCYNTVRDYTGLASPSSLLVKELFGPVSVITSSLLVTKLVRLSSDGGKISISKNAHISVNIWSYEKFEIVEQSNVITISNWEQSEHEIGA